MGYLPFMPGAMKLRVREHWAECNQVRYYELDAADLDRECAQWARAEAGRDLFLWFWFRPDVAPRVGDRWDHKPGMPYVQPPGVNDVLELNDESYRVLKARRVRMDNYGWAVVRKV